MAVPVGGGRSRSRSRVCASLGHHQSPFPRNVAGQGPPGHIAGFQLVTFGGEHVSSLEAETGPRAGRSVRSCGSIDHAASSSLSGDPAGRQEPSQSFSHCHAEPTKPTADRYSISHNVYYVTSKIAAQEGRASPVLRSLTLTLGQRSHSIPTASIVKRNPQDLPIISRSRNARLQ